MSVLAVTIFVSCGLAVFFVGAFLYHHDFSGGDADRDSLLPFRDEPTKRPPAAPSADSQHPHS